MVNSTNKKKRRSIRIKGYDYSGPGAYFVTICTQDRKCLFGDVNDRIVRLSEIGKCANDFWLAIPMHCENVQLDQLVVMPNHIHGIIVMTNACRDVKFNVPTKVSGKNQNAGYYSKMSPQRGTLSVIVRTYESAVTRWCKKNGHEYFQWQGRFYEHVIRNEKELHRIRQYIVNNPKQWEMDKDNPKNFKKGEK